MGEYDYVYSYSDKLLSGDKIKLEKLKGPHPRTEEGVEHEGYGHVHNNCHTRNFTKNMLNEIEGIENLRKD